MNPKIKLNPEAAKLARGDGPMFAFLAEVALRAMNIKNEVRDALQKQGAIMRKIAEDGERRLEESWDDALARARSISDEHSKIIDRMREVQPELADVEFSYDPEEGTAEIIGPLGCDLPEGAVEFGDGFFGLKKPKQEEESPEIPPEIMGMVEKLLAGMGAKPS